MALPFLYLIAIANNTVPAAETISQVRIFVSSLKTADIEVDFPWITSTRTLRLAGDDKTAEIVAVINWSDRQAAYTQTTILRSSREVSVQVVRYFHNPFEYAVFPVTDSSTEFYLAAHSENTPRGESKSEFTVVNGPYPSTIHVTKQGNPDLNVVGPVSLEPYKAFTWVGNETLDDVTGLRVVSTNLVSVYAHHKCARVPSTIGWCDTVYNQIPPVSDAATEFVTGQIMGRTSPAGYTIRIVAIKKRTGVIIGYLGNVIIDASHGVGNQCQIKVLKRNRHRLECSPMLTPGSFVELLLDDALKPAHVRCSKDCFVYQYNHGWQAGENITTTGIYDLHYKSDPFITLVPPVRQQLSDGDTQEYVDGNQAFFHTLKEVYAQQEFWPFVTIIVPKGEDFEFNDQPKSAISGLMSEEIRDWESHSFPIVDGFHRVRVNLGVSLVVQVYGHGVNGALSYGFPAAFKAWCFPDSTAFEKCLSGLETWVRDVLNQQCGCPIDYAYAEEILLHSVKLQCTAMVGKKNHNNC